MHSAVSPAARHPPEAAPPGLPGRLVAGHFSDGICRDTWRERGTRDWLLIVTVRGRGRVGHTAGDVFTGPGEALLLQPGTRHDYGSERLGRAWEFYWAHFLPRPELTTWMAWPEAAPGVRRARLGDARARAAVLRACRALVRRNLRPTRHGEALAHLALEEVLVRCDQARVRRNGEEGDPRVRRVIDDLTLDPAARPRLAELARRAGLSPGRFNRLFRRDTGLPPLRYLEALRLNRAARLLELTPAKVESVARQVGYDNPFYFTLRFKRHTGRSPTAWRAEAARGRRAGQTLPGTSPK